MRPPLTSEGRRSRLARLIAGCYARLPGRLRGSARRVIAGLEGGEMLSATLRQVMERYHGITVGFHSYGCFDPSRFPACSVGRYASVGPGVRVFRRNHPSDRISLHPYFYNTSLGVSQAETMPPRPLAIADDVWIGANALLLPGCSRVGRGAVVGAGAVVTRDVPDYAVVAGNPARIIRERFPAAIQRTLDETRWWMRPRHDLATAFTGASKDRAGAASMADGGTLFLDEICEIDFDLQAKLLRFIQLESFRRVGGSKTEQADIRFVCATNRDPLAEVKAQRFREDLYYRLHVVPVEMPPLRTRGDDVLLLAEHFLDHFARRDGKAFSGFDETARAALASHSWPGNVRELQNAIQQAVVLNPGPLLTAAALTPGLQATAGTGSQRPAPSPAAREPEPRTASADQGEALLPLWKIEKDAITRTLEACGGDVQNAAVVLEISASTVYRKLQSWQKAALA